MGIKSENQTISKIAAPSRGPKSKLQATKGKENSEVTEQAFQPNQQRNLLVEYEIGINPQINLLNRIRNRELQFERI